jgi:predicted permease
MRLGNRLRYLLHRRHFESELDEELRIHREMAEESLRRGGAPPLEAKHVASRVLGNVTLALEDSRALWNFTWLESLVQDFRYATRVIVRAPAFALTVIGTIGLALGLNTTLFTIFNAYVLRPFAVRDPYSLFQFAWNTKQGSHYLFTPQEFENVRTHTNVFSDVFAFESTFSRVIGQSLFGQTVSGNYFTTLGVNVAMGRTLLPADDTATGSGAVLVLSHRAWVNKFAADPDILGKKLTLLGHPYEIIGIAKPEFNGLGDVPMDFWVPLSMSRQLDAGPDLFGPEHPDQFRLIGRLKRGVSLQQAQAAVAVWARQVTAERSEAERAIGVSFWPRATSIPMDIGALAFFSPIVVAFGLVLLIACANVANMMLARGMARQREIGVRLSLGASRSRLVRQLLTESLLLALPASAVGFVIAQATVHFGQQLMFATIPSEFAKAIRVLPLAPDTRVFVFILIAAGFATLVFGLVPALQATRPGLMYAMRGDFSTDFLPARLRNGLVISQVTVCVLLLICSGVLLRGTRRIQEMDVGLATRQVLGIAVREKLRVTVAEHVISEPLVETVAIAWHAPLLDGLSSVPVAPAGQANRTRAGYNFVSPGYFTVFGIELIQGRTFSAEEAAAEAPVVIASAATARRFWPAGDALGQVIRIEPDPKDDRDKKLPSHHTARIVGIAQDVTSGWVPAGKDATCFYFPTSPQGVGIGYLFVRVRGDAEVARRLLDASLTKIAPDAVETIIPMQDVLDVTLYPFRVASWISSMLGGLAMILTLSGIYGVMSYLVSQRTKEIGIRIALGATPANVIQMVLKQSMRLAMVGMAIGILLALGVSRIFASHLVMMNTFDGLAYAGGISLVVASAATAAFYPSRRAAQIDPATTLRCD